VAGGFPAISGNELIGVLTKSFDCEEAGRTKHGMAIVRKTENRQFFAVVPTKNDSLPKGTLGAILRELGLKKEDIKERL
jgi:hypothetical protein